MRQLRDGRPVSAAAPKYPLRFPAHLPPVVLPAPEPRPVLAAQRLEPAPMPPLVFDEVSVDEPVVVQAAVGAQSLVFRNYLENQHRTHTRFLDLRARLGGMLSQPAPEWSSDVPQPPASATPRGPTFDRELLPVLGSGTFSSMFGPLFEQ